MSKQQPQPEPNHTEIDELDFVIGWINENRPSEDELKFDEQLESYDLRKR